MIGRTCAGLFVALGVLAGAQFSFAADEATLLRLFLTDGTTLVSYGEPARVGDRVVFSMPTATTPNPPLHLVNIPAARVDWDRTNRYATSARAARYAATQADADYAALSNQLAQTLADVTATTDSAQRLKLVEAARKALAEWPQNHYNYRIAEVRQMLSMLDDAIVDLRAQSGAQRFNISLSAFAEPTAIVEPLLPPPTPQEAIQQILLAAAVADTPVDRKSLFATALISLDRDAALLPGTWVTSTRAAANAGIQVEVTADRQYQAFSKRTLGLASQRARFADVRGLERLVAYIHQRDAAMGKKRPATVDSLVAAVEDKLDAARRLQLARDRWLLREPVFREYTTAMAPPLDLFAQLKPALESIRSLSGTPPPVLAMLQRTVDNIVRQLSLIVPPDEAKAAHALLVSAVELARNAGRIRREATLASDIARAWDASSAAAGALMLAARARTDIDTVVQPPQLP